MSTIEELQAWYAAQCDGDWEHQSGVKIDSLDNPGWRVTIDVCNTPLHGVEFEELKDNYDHAQGWMRCWVEGTAFHGACGPLRLEDVFRVFLDWNRTSGQGPRSHAQA